MGKKEDDLVNIDDGENWTVAFRKNKLKAMGWTGTLGEWLEATELLNENPLVLDPPATSLDNAKKSAKNK